MGTEKMKHTEGLLTWGYRYIAKPDQNEAGGYKHIAMHPSGEMQPEGGEWEANARRLVACWNACRAIGTDTLERYVNGIITSKMGYKRFAELEEQRDQLLEALKALIIKFDQETCRHEQTHRGGAIWEICSECGEKWADDRGGKPEFVEPAEIIQARATIAACGGE